MINGSKMPKVCEKKKRSDLVKWINRIRVSEKKIWSVQRYQREYRNQNLRKYRSDPIRRRNEIIRITVFDRVRSSITKTNPEVSIVSLTLVQLCLSQHSYFWIISFLCGKIVYFFFNGFYNNNISHDEITTIIYKSYP